MYHFLIIVFVLSITRSSSGQTSDQIVFQSYRGGFGPDIYVMNTDGSNVRNLTNRSDMWNKSPSISPDGRKIAFISRGQDVYLMDIDGGNLVNITHDAADNDFPVWSPDGSRIIFERFSGASDLPGDTWDLWIMNSDGTNQVRLTDFADDEKSPTWSPDGRKIAFTTSRDGNVDIHTIDVDGTNLKNITTHSSVDADASWSPDGSRLAFVSNREGCCDI